MAEQPHGGIPRTVHPVEQLTVTEHSDTVEFTDRGLAALSGLRKLRGLRIQGAQITGRGFSSLRAVTSLEGIAFAGNRSARGTDISALAQLPRLREIVLWVPGDFTDAELLKFGECQRLQHVCVFGAEQVTQRGIDALRAALPGCVVHVRAELGTPKYDDLRKK